MNEFNPMGNPSAFKQEPTPPEIDPNAVVDPVSAETPVASPEQAQQIEETQELPPVEEQQPPVEETQPSIQEQPSVEETQPPVEEPQVEVATPKSVVDSLPTMREKAHNQLELTEEAKAVRDKLAKEPKMPMFIPLDPGEKPGAYRAVTINGYRSEVKKGVMVSLPMSMAKLLMDSYQIEAEALNDHEYNLQHADEATRRSLSVD